MRVLSAGGNKNIKSHGNWDWLEPILVEMKYFKLEKDSFQSKILKWHTLSYSYCHTWYRCMMWKLLQIDATHKIAHIRRFFFKLIVWFFCVCVLISLFWGVSLVNQVEAVFAQIPGPTNATDWVWRAILGPLWHCC